MNPAGTWRSSGSPKKSFIWVEKIVRAIPLVKPTTIGYGMNLKMAPILNTPIRIRNTPAMIVAMMSPCIPYCATIPATMTMNAPVGPPMRKLDPPKKEIRKPATIAVIRPCWGVTPLAIPNAIAKGNAMIPTIKPAMRSDTNFLLSYPPCLNSPKNLG